jgi:beta-phosphoglucomutase
MPVNTSAPLSTTIKCLICDLDGTLVWTREANFLAYRRALAEIGRDLHAAEYTRAFGLRADRLLGQVAPGLSSAQIAQIRRRKAELYTGYFPLVEVNLPLVGFLRAMKPDRHLALATTASRENAEQLLRHLDLLDLFDVRVCGEDVAHGKPDPECFQICMQRCRVQPSECLIFEDSESGAIAAAASGASVMLVPQSVFRSVAAETATLAGERERADADGPVDLDTRAGAWN